LIHQHHTGQILAAARHHRIELTTAAAERRLQRYGSVEAVVRQLELEHIDRQERAFIEAYRRLQRDYYHRDAWGRHAAVVGVMETGSQGWRASMLLLAAEDAALKAPGPDKYRQRLHRIVRAEITRRFPPAPGRVMPAKERTEPSRHEQIVAAFERDWKQATELALRSHPELAQRIDAMGSKQLRTGVQEVLDEISLRLKSCAREHWTPNPDRYRREVVQAAKLQALKV